MQWNYKALKWMWVATQSIWSWKNEMRNVWVDTEISGFLVNLSTVWDMRQYVRLLGSLSMEKNLRRKRLHSIQSLEEISRKDIIEILFVLFLSYGNSYPSYLLCMIGRKKESICINMHTVGMCVGVCAHVCVCVCVCMVCCHEGFPMHAGCLIESQSFIH